MEIIAKLDFTSKRKAMSTIVSSQNAKNMLLKGAPDRILENCTSYMSLAGTNKMSDQDRRAFSKQVAELAGQGLRVLAIAEIPNAGALSSLTKDNKQSLLGDITKYDQYEKDATLVGIVAIKDPIRE
jgi:Ca2+-transporting ATPase